MKKLIRVFRFESDVLIIDTVGSDFVIKCIPEELSYSVVEVRKGIPYIPRLFFFIRLCARVSQFGLKNKALMSAIVDSINPKAIISFIDNSLIMGQLDSIFPHKLVISIQNGTRMSPGGFLNGNPNFMLQHYFSFGKYEKDVIKRYQIKCKEIYNIGSLKAGIFLDNHHESILQTDCICLISQHWMIKDDEVKNDYMEKLKCVFLNLLSWNKNHEYKIKIAMRSKKSATVDYKNEFNFYSDNNTTKKEVSSSEIKVNPEELPVNNNENSIIPNIEIVDRMMTYKPVELKEKSNKKLLDKSNEILLDIPADYNGIIHISLIIYNSYDYVLSGGITQLNTFLETYNKLN